MKTATDQKLEAGEFEDGVSEKSSVCKKTKSVEVLEYLFQWLIDIGTNL